MLKKEAKDRPRINTILNFPIVNDKIRSLLSEKEYYEVLMNTIKVKPMKEKLKEVKKVKEEENKDVSEMTLQISNSISSNDSSEVDRKLFE